MIKKLFAHVGATRQRLQTNAVYYLAVAPMLAVSDAAVAQEKAGDLVERLADENVGPIYTALVAIAALGGFGLVAYGFWGLYARKNDPQNWSVGKAVGAILIGGALLVVPYLALVSGETFGDGNSDRPDFMS